jgi:glycogen(starch) synthase
MAKNKIFYACSGAADLINSYQHWKNGEHDPHEVSITFSGQILEYCKESNSEIYMISPHTNGASWRDGDVVIEHRPKPKTPFVGSGLSYHLGEFIYGFILLWKALRFRSNIALIDSGATYYFMLFLFRAFGIKVIPILHNTLWPAGFSPSKLSGRVILWCDRWFFCYGANAVLSVSKECEEQVLQLCGSMVDEKLVQFRAQFHKEYFDNIALPPVHEQRPFKIMFIGRIEVFKGVLDILGMAKQLDNKYPNQFQWVICGTGPALAALQAKAEDESLTEIVNIAGWVELEQLIELYRDCHISIVPTTDGFNEGLAMTAAESVLSGRPFIASGVVPAAGEMKTACYKAITNDINSFVEGIEKMAMDKDFYEKMRLACPEESLQFLDRRKGLTAMLHQVLSKL